MEAGLKNVDGAVDEYKRQNDLINLQAQFIGCVWCGHGGCVFGVCGYTDGRLKPYTMILPTDDSYVDLYAPDRHLLKEVRTDAPDHTPCL